MERKDVLEIKIIDTLITENGIDYIICKLSQKTEVLKRGVNTEYSKSFEYPGWDIRNKQLYTLGVIKEYDNLPFAVPTSDIELLKEKVKAINEKYGIKKRWRAKYNDIYFCIDEYFEVTWHRDNQSSYVNRKFEKGNYFRTKKEAEEYVKYIEQKSLEWHEKRENNE